MWKRDKRKPSLVRDGNDYSGSGVPIFTRAESPGTGTSSPSPNSDDFSLDLRDSPPESPAGPTIDAAIAGQLVATSFAAHLKTKASTTSSGIFQRATLVSQDGGAASSFSGEEFLEWCVQQSGVSKKGAKSVAKWMAANVVFNAVEKGQRFGSATKYTLNMDLTDGSISKAVLNTKTSSAIEMLSKASSQRDVKDDSTIDTDLIFRSETAPQQKKKANDNRVYAGTVDRLIERVTNESRPDTSFRDVFLFTFPTFISITELMLKLRERWYLQPPANSSDAQVKIFETSKRKPVRIRVLNVLKTLLENIPETFDDVTARAQLEEFIDTVRSSMSVVAADQLCHLMLHEVDKVPNTEDNIDPINAYENIAILLSFEASRDRSKEAESLRSLLSHSIDEVATQMALVDNMYWMKLKLGECMFKAWTKARGEDVDDPSPTIRTFTDRFNMVAAWISTMVVSHVRLVDRVRELGQAILLAHYLTELKDFFGAFAVMAGLNGTAVNRLGKTWEKLDGEEYAIYQRLKETYSSDSNYKTYREHVSHAHAPCTPYIGLFLKDLVFIEDGNPDKVENGRLINFHKRVQLAAVLSQIRRLQSDRYTFKPNMVLIQQLVSLPMMGDTETYLASKRLEPREPFAAIEHLNIKEDDYQERMADLEAKVEGLEHSAAEYRAQIAFLQKQLRENGIVVQEDSEKAWHQARVSRRQGSRNSGLLGSKEGFGVPPPADKAPSPPPSQ